MWARWTGPRLGLAAVVHILSPTTGLYILMPESRPAHNNTIGLTRFLRALSRCQTFAILRLTPRKPAHISAAPTANGAYRNVARISDEGFCDPKGARLPEVSTTRSCVLCIVGLERDTPAAANVFASVKTFSSSLVRSPMPRIRSSRWAVI